MKLYHNKVKDCLGTLPDNVSLQPSVFITLEDGDKFYVDGYNIRDWEKVEDEATAFNIKDILLDAPAGYKMDSPVLGEVSFINHTKNKIYVRYKAEKDKNMAAELDIYGRLNSSKGCQCVIFPKGKKTWFGFKPDWKKEPDHKIFQAGQKVIVAHVYDVKTLPKWVLYIYSHYDNNIKKHVLLGCRMANDVNILPYKGNESLLGQVIDERRGF